MKFDLKVPLGAIVSLAQWREPTLALLVLLLMLPSLGRAATASAGWPVGQVASKTANIPSPANTQVNTFASTSGPWNYVAYPFTVTTSGNYTATASTAVSVNTTWFVRGNFVPGTPMGTPVTDFFAGVFASSGPAPFTGNFPSVPLVAGQQYTMLVAYNSGSVAGEVSTVTINGPGCVNVGTNVCTSASIPTLSEWALIGLSSLLAMFGLARMRRRST